jgi:hypothetical protein
MQLGEDFDKEALESWCTCSEANIQCSWSVVF